MLQFRITKYDPAYRNSEGRYTREEWTSSNDIGRTINGSVLTQADYEQVEDAYVRTAMAFLNESGVTSLSVIGLENAKANKSVVTEGQQLNLSQIGETIRRLLREEFWCRLETSNSFVHVGYDYYMYVAVPSKCPRGESMAKQLGLFVEHFESPHGT